jgi:hypothetical protein
LKEEALDRTMWRNRFGGGFEPVVRQNTEWMFQGFLYPSDEDLLQDILKNPKYSLLFTDGFVEWRTIDDILQDYKAVLILLTNFYFIFVPYILITLKFLSPKNAPLYYTYKMLKYTDILSYDCSYMFRSTWTIIRELMLNLAEVTILWK